MQALVIRRAESAEAAFLSALAFRSKAHWGYDQAFLDACVAPLTITGDRIETSPVYVGAVGSQVVGFYGLGALDDEADLAFLFVEPATTGRGYGRQRGVFGATDSNCTQQRIAAAYDQLVHQNLLGNDLARMKCR